MGRVLVENNAYSTLAAGIAAGDLALAVATGEGARFPSIDSGNWFYATIQSAAGAWEIVKVTARATDTFTIERNVDSSTGAAQAWSAGDLIFLSVCTQALEDLIEYFVGQAVDEAMKKSFVK